MLLKIDSGVWLGGPRVDFYVVLSMIHEAKGEAKYARINSNDGADARRGLGDGT